MNEQIATSAVSIFYTFIHILPGNLLQIYVYRNYRRFSYGIIFTGFILLFSVEACLQIYASSVYSRKIAFPFHILDVFYLLAIIRVPSAKLFVMMNPMGYLWLAVGGISVAFERTFPVFSIPYLEASLFTLGCLPFVIPLLLLYVRKIVYPLLLDNSFHAIWRPLALLAVLNFGLTFLLTPFNELTTNSAILVRLLSFLAGFIGIGLALYAMRERLAQQEVRKRLALEAQVAEALREHTRQVEANDQEVAQFRQDFVYLIEQMRKDLDTNNWNGILQLGEKAMHGIDVHSARLSENDSVNAILGYWQPTFERSSVQAEYHVNLQAEDPIDPLDMTAILGNLLRNAAEALEKVPPKERKLRLAIEEQAGYLFFVVDNSFDGQAQFNANGMPLSAKRDFKEVGIGIESIQASLARYHGTMDIKTEQKNFEVSIMMPLVGK